VLAVSDNVHSFTNELIIAHNDLEVKDHENYPVSSEKVKSVTSKYHDYFQKFNDTYGYYDVFLICAKHGHIMYSVAKESDYGENLSMGKLRDSGLGELWKMVTRSGKASLVDMRPYAPSNDEPAMFMGVPVLENGKQIAVLAIQVSDKAITAITSGRSGMGDTGEVYLVGEDKLMRSDSFLDPVNHSLKASFANPAKGSVTSDAVVNALTGKTSTEIVIDYNNNPVLSAYQPLEFTKHFNANFKWIVLAEIDEAEVTIPTESLKMSALIMGVVFLVLIIVIALVLGNMISKPIFEAVRSITESNKQVVSASSEISDSATSLAEGASNQASSVEEVSATIKESTAINTQNSENSNEADILAKTTKESAQDGLERGNELLGAMKEINSSSEKISKIIKTIDEIASQTKLLALNAAVEAARAGEHGLGFAVVADEVKSLAGRSADAATETANIIEESIKQVNNGSDIAEKASEAFGDILERINKTSNLIGEISISAKEQSQGMNQIASAMGQIDQVTQQNAATSEEAAAAAEELNAQAVSMKDTVDIVGRMVGYIDEQSVQHNTSSKSSFKKAAPMQKNKTSNFNTTAKANNHASSSNEVFPLGEDDLKEF
jgi:methyl-accepting chemotaxis protein